MTRDSKVSREQTSMICRTGLFLENQLLFMHLQEYFFDLPACNVILHSRVKQMLSIKI